MNTLMRDEMEYDKPQWRDKLLPSDGIKAGFLEEVALDQLLRPCRIWSHRKEGRAPQV